MSDIPSEVFRDILLRLPAESLFRFRSVCKAWRRIIDDPSFIKSHSNSQDSSTTLLIRTPIGTPIYYLSLDSLNYADGPQIIDVTRVKTLNRTDVPRLRLLPVASCNGLILISHGSIKKIWVIWNPLTREFHELPESDAVGFLMGTGLGYDYAVDDYKVVRIHEVVRTDEMFHGRKIVYETHVYSLKLDSWKMIKDCPCDFVEKDQGVFLNGTLYWRSWDTIIALDLGTEDYSQLSLPSVRPCFASDTNLAALGGCLVLSYSGLIWVMKDDGVKKSWTELFSFQRQNIGGRPVAYLKSKGQVILHQESRFFWLDINKSTVKKFTIDDLPYHFYTSQICPGSLFRLKQSCDVSRNVAQKITATKRKRNRKRKSDRGLKFSVKVTDIWWRSDSDCYSY